MARLKKGLYSLTAAFFITPAFIDTLQFKSVLRVKHPLVFVTPLPPSFYPFPYKEKKFPFKKKQRKKIHEITSHFYIRICIPIAFFRAMHTMSVDIHTTQL